MPPAAPRRARSLRARSGAAASSLSKSNLGEKVSVLFRLHGDPQHPFSEAVGVLQRVEGGGEGQGRFWIMKRDGSLVEVREADVVSAKVVPRRA